MPTTGVDRSLNEALRRYHVLLDTSFAMEPNFLGFVEKHGDIFDRNPIVVRGVVMTELRRKCLSEREQCRKLAATATQLTETLLRRGRAVIQHDESDEGQHADAVILRVVEQYLMKMDWLVLTNDVDLMLDLYDKLDRRSVRVHKQLLVAKLNAQTGRFEEFRPRAHRDLLARRDDSFEPQKTTDAVGVVAYMGRTHSPVLPRMNDVSFNGTSGGGGPRVPQIHVESPSVPLSDASVAEESDYENASPPRRFVPDPWPDSRGPFYCVSRTWRMYRKCGSFLMYKEIELVFSTYACSIVLALAILAWVILGGTFPLNLAAWTAIVVAVCITVGYILLPMVDRYGHFDWALRFRFCRFDLINLPSFTVQRLLFGVATFVFALVIGPLVVLALARSARWLWVRMRGIEEW